MKFGNGNETLREKEREREMSSAAPNAEKTE